MRALLLAALLTACAPIAAPKPSAPEKRPPETVAKPSALHGSLLVYAMPLGLAVCRTECRPLPELAHPAMLPRRVAPGQYLFAGGSLSLSSGSSGALAALPPPLDAAVLGEGATWLLDGGIVHVEHLANSDRLRLSRGGAPFALLGEPVPPKSYDYHFLPDGRHLFKTAPKMGAQESDYFSDVIDGQTVTLQYTSKLGAAPKKLASAPQFMHPDFVGDGSHVVAWIPGGVDVANNTRTLRLSGFEVSTGQALDLGTVTTAAITQTGPASGGSPIRGGLVYRDTPRTLHHVHSRFVVHEDGADQPLGVRVVDALAGTSFLVPLAPHERLVAPFDVTHRMVGGTDGRRDDDVLILTRETQDGVVVRVLALPGLQPVMQVLVPSSVVYAVDFVRD